jgi:hypothetical protein
MGPKKISLDLSGLHAQFYRKIAKDKLTASAACRDAIAQWLGVEAPKKQYKPRKALQKT